MVFKKTRLALSSREIGILRQLCSGSKTASALAKAERVGLAYVSQLLKSLREKNLVSVADGREVALSDRLEASEFKALVDSRPSIRLEDWLSGQALEVLICTLWDEGLSIPLIAEEARLSVPTVYRVVKRLQAAGVVAKVNDRIKVTDNRVAAFANSFADQALFPMLKEFKGHNTCVRVRKHVVIRTDAVAVPDYATLTGLNALAGAGLEAIGTSYRDYYFNLDMVRRKFSLEENFIHALLLSSLQQHQDETVLAAFWAKNGRRLDRMALKHAAEFYTVGTDLSLVLGEMRRAIDLADKLRG